MLSNKTTRTNVTATTHLYYGSFLLVLLTKPMPEFVVTKVNTDAQELF